MTAKVAISRTRSFASDGDGMPVSRQLSLADQAEPQPLQLHQTAAEELQRAYLAATGVEAIGHEPPRTLTEAYLVATDVPRVGPSGAEPDEPVESNDPLGDAWIAVTTPGWCA